MRISSVLTSLSVLSTMVAASPAGSFSSVDYFTRNLNSRFETKEDVAYFDLGDLHTDLTKFFHGSEFKNIEFTEAIAENKRHFANVDKLIHTLPSMNLHLEQSLKTTRKVFDAMVKAAESLDYFVKNTSEGARIASEMSVINARALMLYSMQTVKDVDIKAHKAEVGGMFCHLMSLVKESKPLSNYAAFVRVVGALTRETAQNVQMLQRHVSNEVLSEDQCSSPKEQVPVFV